MKQLKEFLEPYSEYQMLIQRVLMIFEIIVFILGLVFKKSFALISIVLALIAVFFGVFTFCFTDEVRAFKQFKLMM